MRALKKRICLRRGYLKYTFESNPRNLVVDVVMVCNILNADRLIVEVFSKDPINESVFQNHEHFGSKVNLVYYQLHDVGFLDDLNLANVRHMCIYSVPTSFNAVINRKWLEKQSMFIMSFDNYLEVSELVVRKKFYSSKVIDQLLSL